MSSDLQIENQRLRDLLKREQMRNEILTKVLNTTSTMYQGLLLEAKCGAPVAKETQCVATETEWPSDVALYEAVSDVDDEDDVVVELIGENQREQVEKFYAWQVEQIREVFEGHLEVALEKKKLLLQLVQAREDADEQSDEASTTSSSSKRKRYTNVGVRDKVLAFVKMLVEKEQGISCKAPELYASFIEFSQDNVCSNVAFYKTMKEFGFEKYKSDRSNVYRIEHWQLQSATLENENEIVSEVVQIEEETVTVEIEQEKHDAGEENVSEEQERKRPRVNPFPRANNYQCMIPDPSVDDEAPLCTGPIDILALNAVIEQGTLNHVPKKLRELGASTQKK